MSPPWCPNEIKPLETRWSLLTFHRHRIGPSISWRFNVSFRKAFNCLCTGHQSQIQFNGWKLRSPLNYDRNETMTEETNSLIRRSLFPPTVGVNLNIFYAKLSRIYGFFMTLLHRHIWGYFIVLPSSTHTVLFHNKFRQARDASPQPEFRCRWKLTL